MNKKSKLGSGTVSFLVYVYANELFGGTLISRLYAISMRAILVSLAGPMRVDPKKEQKSHTSKVDPGCL